MKTTSSLSFGGLLAGVLLLGTGGSAAASEWNIDPDHSTAQFSVKHMMVTTVRGHFDKLTGSASLNDQDLGRSSIDVQIDAASINTRNDKRDGHLRSPDFFDAEKHPKITFKSTKISKAGKNRWKVLGDLTMRGVTKPVTLDVEGPTPAQKNLGGLSVRGVVATGKINRKDWGLTWNKGLETGGVLVGDEVTIQMDVELVEKPAAAAAAAK